MSDAQQSEVESFNQEVEKSEFRKKRARVLGSYYKREAALELIPTLDAMIDDKKAKRFRYERFAHLSKKSLYLKINQSWLFIIDYMDDDKRYLKLRQQTKISEDKDIGVTILFRAPGGEAGMVAESPEDGETSFTPKWRKDLEKYIKEGKADEMFHKKNLALTAEDIDWVYSSLGGLDGIVFKVNPREIRVIKTGEEVKPNEKLQTTEEKNSTSEES